MRNLYEFLAIELPMEMPNKYSAPEGIERYASDLRKYYFAPEGDTLETSWFKNRLPGTRAENGESGEDVLLMLCRAEL